MTVMASSKNSSMPELFENELSEKGVVQTVPALADDPRTNAELQRALRKVDYRLIPPLAILYLFSYLDRGSLANASIFGIKEDLGLSPAQYNMLVTVFFFVSGESRRRLTPDLRWYGSAGRHHPVLRKAQVLDRVHLLRVGHCHDLLGLCAELRRRHRRPRLPRHHRGVLLPLGPRPRR
jgi:hypothetical protein